MKRRHLLAVCSSLFLTGALLALTPEAARGQEAKGEAVKPAQAVAEKLDAYGKLGHCDLTARLDNLAISLQNDPGLKAYIISFGSTEKKHHHNYADWQLKHARYYLTEERGVDPARIVVINGGRKDVENGLTELWLVPEGATPPATPSDTDKYAAADFSGQFDVYVTDENIYKEIIEMGVGDDTISRSGFAEKLKQQTESVGYLVVRTPKDAAPSAWRRIARRDERILQKDYGVEPARLESIDGGNSEGEDAEVELWILPKSAPPPAGNIEKLERKPNVAFKLNTYSNDGMTDEDAEHWVLENLSEMLRQDARATGYIIAREPYEPEASDWDESASGTEEAAGVTGATGSSQAVEAAAAESTGEAVEEPEETKAESSMKEIAARWREILSHKYGIEASRIVVLEGRRMPWSNGRLTTWVAPEKAQPPDAFARDKDEPEEDDNAGEATASTATPPALR